MVSSHCWPRFGQAEVKGWLEGHRDNYRYLHDQTVRLMNQGLTGEEIADRLALPLPSGHAIICLSLTPSPISASDIRQRIRGGALLANLLPPPVESYILHQRLYQEDGNRTHI